MYDNDLSVGFGRLINRVRERKASGTTVGQVPSAPRTVFAPSGPPRTRFSPAFSQAPQAPKALLRPEFPAAFRARFQVMVGNMSLDQLEAYAMGLVRVAMQQNAKGRVGDAVRSACMAINTLDRLVQIGAMAGTPADVLDRLTSQVNAMRAQLAMEQGYECPAIV